MIPFIDLAAQQERIKPQLEAAIAGVLAHGKYIMGPEVKELETAMCEFTGSKHCISMSNGTDALVAAYMALGVGPGDAVITTPFTFFATIEAIQILGATPVFADIDPQTFNICPNDIERAIKQVQSENKLKLKGICPVDLFGLCADYSAINQLAQQHGLFVLQDAAQAFGATQEDRKAPSHGTIGTASFFPAKPLGCYGDGGAVFTDDDGHAELLRSIRVHGKGVDKYDNVRVGQNCRLDTIQAAILLEKLRIYPSELDARQAVAANYAKHLTAINERLDQPVVIPQIPDNNISAWAQYTIRVNDREAIMASLKDAGIPSVVYYRAPAHLLGACSSLGHAVGDFPHSELAAKQVMSLPFHPYLTEAVIEKIVASIEQSRVTA
jgi:UDP-2-acetamido-2-deoxy-ribo-hexuluronate aminotransferase